jgi:predicted membrane-bound mannosyltransferase
MKVLQSRYGWEAQKGLWLGRNGLATAVCIVVVLGVGLRAYALGFQSLWTDEISSLMITDPTLPFHQFWDRVLADTHPPIYYLLLRWSSSAFGQSEIVARAPSVLFGILTVCAAGVLAGASLSRSSRVALPLLLAVSPGAVWYAREARSYALLLLLSTVITVACIRSLRCTPHEDGEVRGALTMLTMAALLASFTHYFGFLLSMAAFFTCFLWLTAGTGPLSSFPVAGLPHYSCHGWFTILGSSPASKRPGSECFRSGLQLTGSNTWPSAGRLR